MPFKDIELGNYMKSSNKASGRRIFRRICLGGIYGYGVVFWGYVEIR